MTHLELYFEALNNWESYMKKKIYLFLLVQILIVSINTLDSIPLFDAYPTLKEKIPYIKLGNFPTPIKKLENLGRYLGAKNLYIKQDNLSGDLFGGNKVRKLEFLLGAAEKLNATGVITTGGAGSNHVLATAAYAKKLDMICYGLLNPQNITSYLRRNLLLMHHYGAKIELFPTRAAATVGILAVDKEYRKVMGHSLFLIPRGGSDEIGCLGFVNAAFELKEQICAGILPEPDFIYIPRGTMGSSVGLILGLKAAGLKSVVVPVTDEPYQDPVKNMVQLFQETNKFIRTQDPTFKEYKLTPEDLAWLHTDFSGAHYAEITPQAADAIKFMYDHENIKLDGTYTGKTCAAMLYDLQNKNIKNKVILFWNTYCSQNFEEITKTINYKDLPEEFHHYFETDLQPLDQGV